MKHKTTTLLLAALALASATACEKTADAPTPPADNKPADNKAADNKPADNKAADIKAEAPAPPQRPLEQARGQLALFQALPKDMSAPERAMEPAKVALGRKLYYDTRLSKNHDLSCNSCHQLEKYGVDGEPTSPGHKRQRGGRNSPTVYNAALHATQFWDGRAADVEAQARGPVLNPIEMAMPDEAQVVKVLKSIPGYADEFKAAFPGQEDPISYDNMATAIGAFERGLVTPSRWDRFLGGDDKALTEAELEGFNTFVEVGCHACHNGPAVGGASFQKLGVTSPWPNQKDPGRFEVTQKEEDRMSFKVPSLRNIDQTGPYFHDGATASLEEAVTLMAQHQLGKTLTAPQLQRITTWLKALTGELPKDYIAKPELPASGPETPAPDPS
jgi:cytochrome c peroxidase